MRWLLLVSHQVALPPSWARWRSTDGESTQDDPDVGESAFVPFDLHVSPALQTQLRAYVTQARQKHYPIKVALIGARYDLGAIPELFGKPQPYAKFLGIELSFLYHRTLLVVMPQGFGIYDNGRSVAARQRVLAKIAVGRGPDGMARSAVVAVRALAAESGTQLTPVALTQPSGHSTTTRDRILLAVAALLGLLVLLLPRRLVGRRRGAA